MKFGVRYCNTGNTVRRYAKNNLARANVTTGLNGHGRSSAAVGNEGGINKRSGRNGCVSQIIAHKQLLASRKTNTNMRLDCPGG